MIQPHVLYQVVQTTHLQKNFVLFSCLKSSESSFLKNTNGYMYSHHKYFTIFVSVLYQTYNHSPSARECISDTTRPFMHVVNSTYKTNRARITYSFWALGRRISKVSLLASFNVDAGCNITSAVEWLTEFSIYPAGE